MYVFNIYISTPLAACRWYCSVKVILSFVGFPSWFPEQTEKSVKVREGEAKAREAQLKRLAGQSKTLTEQFTQKQLLLEAIQTEVSCESLSWLTGLSIPGSARSSTAASLNTPYSCSSSPRKKRLSVALSP